MFSYTLKTIFYIKEKRQNTSKTATNAIKQAAGESPDD
jgi:hypothetical protein